MVSFYRPEKKVKKQMCDLDLLSNETENILFDIKNKGKVFERVTVRFKRDLSNNRNMTNDITKITEKTFLEEKKNRDAKIMRENASAKNLKPNSLIFINRDNMPREHNRIYIKSRENLLSKNYNRKKYLKKSYILDSKVNSPFSSNNSVSGLNNLTPKVIKKNTNNHICKIPQIRPNIRRNIDNSIQNLYFFSSNDEKENNTRSTSFNIKNSRNLANNIDQKSRKTSVENKLFCIKKDQENNKKQMNISKANMNIETNENKANVEVIITNYKNIGKVLLNDKNNKIPPRIREKKLVEKEIDKFKTKNQNKDKNLVSRNLSKDIEMKDSNKRMIETNIKDYKSNRGFSSNITKNDKINFDNDKNKFIKENAKNLSSHHLEELKNINDVYFFRESNKKEDDIINNDDPKGHYKIHIGDHIYYRYEIVRELGRGSFGQAIKCYDHKRRKYVCIKIIKNRSKVYKQSKIEISILEYIMKENKDDSANIINILSYFYFRNHMCIVFELLEHSLYDLLKSYDFKGVSLDTVKKFSYQILSSLAFLNKHKIIHCDLKPENILLKKKDKTGLKIIDFGSSCFNDQKLYTYIQSRYYRAPEIILGYEYGFEIDLWSFGCIVVELFAGYPIFSGENEKEQLSYIMEYLGVPPLIILEKSKRKSKFFDENNEPLLYKTSKGKTRRPDSKRLEEFLECEDENFISFVKSFLNWEPSKRLIAQEALSHPFLQDILKKI